MALPECVGAQGEEVGIAQGEREAVSHQETDVNRRPSRGRDGGREGGGAVMSGSHGERSSWLRC